MPCCQFNKRLFESGPDHNDDFVDGNAPINPAPCMGNHRTAGDLQEELVDAGPHPGTPSGRDDDCGIHD
jgi:hypothetical protein